MASSEDINMESTYFENDILINAKVTPTFLKKLIEKKIIQPKSNKYSANDLEIIKFAKKFENNEFVLDILASYSKIAEELALAEKKFFSAIIKEDLSESEKENIVISIINDFKKKILISKTIEILEN
jgi:hypothetical protein